MELRDAEANMLLANVVHRQVQEEHIYSYEENNLFIFKTGLILYFAT